MSQSLHLMFFLEGEASQTSRSPLIFTKGKTVVVDNRRKPWERESPDGAGEKRPLLHNVTKTTGSNAAGRSRYSRLWGKTVEINQLGLQREELLIFHAGSDSCTSGHLTLKAFQARVSVWGLTQRSWGDIVQNSLGSFRAR